MENNRMFSDEAIAWMTKPIPLWIRFMLLFRPTIKSYDSGYCGRCKIYKGKYYWLGTVKVKDEKKGRRYIRIDKCAAIPLEGGAFLRVHFFNRDLDGIEEGDRVTLGLKGDTYPYRVDKKTEFREGSGMVTMRFQWDPPNKRGEYGKDKKRRPEPGRRIGGCKG